MLQDSISSSPLEIAYHFTTLDPVKIGKPLKTFEKGSNEVLAVASLRDVFKSELKENRVGGCKWISPLSALVSSVEMSLSSVFKSVQMAQLHM
jgi:hypothetical protein